MQPNEQQTTLLPLDKSELLIIIRYVRARWVIYKIACLRPAQIFTPLTAIQVGTLTLAAIFFPNIIYLVAVWNYILFCLAMLVMHTSKRMAKQWPDQTVATTRLIKQLVKLKAWRQPIAHFIGRPRRSIKYYASFAVYESTLLTIAISVALVASHLPPAPKIIALLSAEFVFVALLFLQPFSRFVKRYGLV